MNPNREEALFALALEKPAEKRAAFLDAMCDGDAALLAAHEQPETLLATQAEAARPTIKLEFADAPDEAVGQTLGRYKLLERVGEGRLRRGLCRRTDRAGAAAGGAESHQAGHGHQAGGRAVRGGAAGAGDDGPSEHRQGARCGDDGRSRAA